MYRGETQNLFGLGSTQIRTRVESGETRLNKFTSQTGKACINPKAAGVSRKDAKALRKADCFGSKPG